MEAILTRIFLILALISSCQCRKSYSRFTNVKCESYDKTFSEFKKCKLNVLGRGVIGIDIYISMLKTPVNNINLNWSMWRRYSGYRPFLFNESANFCQLMARPHKISFTGLVLNAILTQSNLNHTCPLLDDVIVDNLVFKDEYLRELPLPMGDYKLQLKFAENKDWKLQVEVFILRDEI